MTISFSGLASGLDTSSWIESLVALKQAKITTLETEKETVSLSQDSLDVVKSFFTAFRSQISNMLGTTSGIYTKNCATSTNSTILSATADTSAKDGIYNISVKKLATYTTAKSNYYSTYYTTTTATKTESTLEENLGLNFNGLNSAVVQVSVGDVTKDLVLYKDDTLSDLVDKFASIGVSASYNETTGVFSANVSMADINDLNGTGIKEKLNLTGVNEGYAGTLQVEETIYSSAADSTKLSQLGSITAGNITLNTNNQNYTISINGDTSIAQLVNSLNTNAGHTIAEYDEITGILTISDAVINDNGTGLTSALGLDIDIYSKTQQTNNLGYSITVTTTATATLNTRISDLGEGVTIDGDKTFTVTNSSNQDTVITVNSSTTLSSLITDLKNAGLSAKLNNDGTLEISGGIITDGTFDATEVLGLTDEPYTAMVTGNSLKEIIEYTTPVTLQTKLVDDLLVTRGYLEITDEEGNNFYEKIYEGQTIGDFMTDLGNLGIATSLDEETGVLEITGGSFRTLGTEEVLELIDDNVINETEEAYKQGTNLLTCLFGSATISPAMTKVSSARAMSVSLNQVVTNTYDATTATTMGAMEVTAGTAIFNVRGEDRTVNITEDMTIADLMSALEAQGISSTWDADNSRLTVNNATLAATGTSNLDEVLDMTTTIAGKYVTSDTMYHLVTTRIDATENTTFLTLGVDTTQVATIYDNENNVAGTFTVTPSTTLGQLVDYINDHVTGVSASLEDGVLTIDNGYISNSVIEEALGLELSSRSSYVLGSVMTTTTTTSVTSDTKLGDIISTLGTTSEVSGGYSLLFNGTDLGVNANTTIDEVISKVYAQGGTAYLDNTGRLAINGGTLTGSVANALGVITVTKTESVIATGDDLNTRTVEYAHRDTTYSDLGITSSSLIVRNESGTAIGTINVTGTDTIGSTLDTLSNNYNIDGIIADGMIQLTSITKNYVTGDLATSLGIGATATTEIANQTSASTADVTYTTTVSAGTNQTGSEITYATTTGTTQTSSTAIQYTVTSGVENTDNTQITYTTTTTAGTDQTSSANITQTVTAFADYTTTMSQLGMASDTNVVITHADGTTNTVTALTTDSLQSLFEKIDDYGVVGSISNGVITFDSEVDGTYISSAPAALGIATANANTTYTVGMTQSSSATVTYTKTTGTDQTSSANIQYTTTAGTDQTSSAAIQYTVTSGTDQTSSAALTATYSTTVTTGTDQTSSAECTYTETVTAGYDTTMAQLGMASNTNVVITHADGTTNTVTALTTDTLQTLFGKIDDYGVVGSISNGIITFDSEVDGTYISSAPAALGIGTAAANQTVTVGTSATSSAAVTYTKTTGTSQTSSAAITYTKTVGVQMGVTLWSNATTGVSQTSTAAITYTKTIGQIQISSGAITYTKTIGTAQTSSTAVTFTIGYRYDSTATVTTTTGATAGYTTKFSELGADFGTDTFVQLFEVTDMQGNNYAISANKNTTFQDVADQLATYGIIFSQNGSGGWSCAHNTGVGCAYYLSSETLEAGQALKLSRSSDTTSYTATSDMTLKDAGILASDNGVFTVSVCVDGTNENLQIHGDSTIEEMCSMLASRGIDAEFRNSTGKLFIKGDENHYISYMSTAASNLHLDSGLNNTYKTVTRTATSDMTLAQAGIYTGTGSTVSISVDGTTESLYINSGMTIENLCAAFASKGITAEFYDGKLRTKGDDNHYIVYDTSGALTNMNISVGSGNTYTTATRTVTSDMTLSQAGITGSGGTIIIRKNDYSFDTITVAQTMTVENLCSALAGADISTTFCDGKFYLNPTGNSYIWSMSGVDLKISTGSEASYTTTVNSPITSDTLLGEVGLAGNYTINVNGTNQVLTAGASERLGAFCSRLAAFGLEAHYGGEPGDYGFVITNNTSSYLVGTTCNKFTTGQGYSYTTTLATATSDMTLAQAGILASGTGTITVNVNGTSEVVTVGANETIDGLCAALGGAGVSASYYDGKFYINPTGTSYITGNSMASNMKIDSSAYSTAAANMTRETLTGDLDSSHDTSFIVTCVSDGTIISKTFEHLTTTVGDVIDFLNGCGIAAYIESGKLITQGTGDDYILSDVGNGFSSLFKMSLGSGSTYTTQTQTTSWNTPSNLQTYTKTSTAIGNTTLAQAGILTSGTGSITVNVNGTSEVLNFGTNETIDGLCAALGGAGISASYYDGKFHINPTGTSYITGNSMASNMKIESSAYTTNTTTTTVNVSGNDTLQQAGILSAGTTGTITVNVNGTSEVITVGADETVDGLCAALGGAGITTSFYDGKFHINPTGTSYITGNSMAGNMKIASSAYSTAAVNATGNTTLAQAGILTSGAGSITVNVDGTNEVLCFASNETIDGLCAALGGAGISASFYDGQFHLNATGTSYIVGNSMAGNMKIASSAYSTTSVDATGNTTLAQAGILTSGTGSITVNVNGTNEVLNFASDETIDGLCAALGGAGVSASYYDGKFHINPTGDSYIVGNSMASNMKIDASAYSTAAANMTRETKLSAIGSNSSQAITCVSDGAVISRGFSGNNTVADVIDFLNGCGIAASISDDGKLVTQGTGNDFISSIDSTLKSALKLTTGSGNTYSTQVETTNWNTPSDTHSFTSTVNATGTTSLKDAGILASGTGSITVNVNGTNEILNFGTDETIDGLCAALGGAGISASYYDGKFHLNPTGDSYIVGNSMADNMKIASSAYSTTTTTNSMGADTLLSRLGINNPSSITVMENGNQRVLNFAAGSTVGDVMAALDAVGISTSLSDGKLTLTPQSGCYITNTGVLANLGVSGTNYSTSSVNVNGNMTLKDAGILASGTGSITVNVDGTNEVLNFGTDETIDGLCAALGGAGISASFYDGQFHLEPTGTSYITGNSMASGMKIATGNNASYTTTAVQMTADNKLSQLGITSPASITVMENGTQRVLNFAKESTVGDVMAALGAVGITASLSSGQLSLTPQDGSYITGLGVLSNLGVTGSTTSTSTATINADSTTKLSTVGATSGSLIVHKTNGTTVNISVDANATLSEFFTQISTYGLVGNIDSSGRVSIVGAGDTWLESAYGGSNVLSALKMSAFTENVYTASVNRTSDELTHTTTIAATGTTKLKDLINASVQSPTSGQLIVSANSDNGNETFTVNFNTTTNSLYDVFDTLAQHGIEASVDALGRVTMTSSSLTDFSLSGDLGTYLQGGASFKSKYYDVGMTYNTTTNLVETTVSEMKDSNKLSKFGITNGDMLITTEDGTFTVTIDNTKNIGDFRYLMSQYGFSSDIDSAGRLSFTGDGDSYASSVTGGSNILDVLGLTDWTFNNRTQESDVLSDAETTNELANMSQKLSQLTDSTGASLGITSGNIYVYQNGTRSTFNINNDETLETLASRLSQYGITMGMSTDGKLYFDGDDNSYLTTTGVTNASNILTKLNISDNWSTRYNSTSTNLSYDLQETEEADDDTLITNLADADGNNLGITTGSFYVYQNGVRTTESITNETTLGSFKAMMASHGLITDETSTNTATTNNTLSVGAYNNTYMATSALAGANSNVVSTLFEEWDFTNVYETNHIEEPQNTTAAISRTTKLADMITSTDGSGNPVYGYTAGNIIVEKDGVQTTISLTQDDTVGTFMDELALFGFDTVINDDGQLIIRTTGNSTLLKPTENASNILDSGIMNLESLHWISTNSYAGDLNTITTATNNVTATQETSLSDLGVTTGEFYIYNNGVRNTAYISSGDTVGSFMDTLKTFGLQSSIDGNGQIRVVGNGDSYVTKSNSALSSNVVSQLFGSNTPSQQVQNIYTGHEETASTHMIAATEATSLSEYYKGTGTTAAGTLDVIVNGNHNYVNVEADDTIGSFLEKVRSCGVEATLNNGELLIQAGYDTITIDETGTGASTVLQRLGVAYQTELGGYVASSSAVMAVSSEDKDVSAAKWASADTALSLLGIKSGTFNVYLDGKKETISVADDDTFGSIQTKLNTAFGTGKINISYDDGYLRFSSSDGAVQVGSTSDGSNFAAITSMSTGADGVAVSARPLYCVNAQTKITTSGVFRNGDVEEGVFVVGNAEISISSDTTISDVITQINSNEDSKATAYWDSVLGTLVIKSSTTGASYINIEANYLSSSAPEVSNFTEVLGFTSNTDGTKKMNMSAQELGGNAKFTINGTEYISTSNKVESDVSKIEGVVLNLNEASDETIQLTVGKDKEAAADTIANVVDSYNNLIDNVEDALSDELKDQKSTLKLVLNNVKQLAKTTLTKISGVTITDASAGNTSTDSKTLNKLTFNKDTFVNNYNLQDIKTDLIGTDGISGSLGTLASSIDSALDGYFTTQTNSYKKKISTLTTKINKANTALETYRSQLEAKFSAMELMISKLQSQYSSFLSS